jgi:hypothetical protein
MPKRMKIYGINLLLLVGYLVLLILTGVNVVFGYLSKRLIKRLSYLKWQQSNIRIKLYEQTGSTR